MWDVLILRRFWRQECTALIKASKSAFALSKEGQLVPRSSASLWSISLRRKAGLGLFGLFNVGELLSPAHFSQARQ